MQVWLWNPFKPVVWAESRLWSYTIRSTGAGQRHPRVGLVGSRRKSRALGPETHCFPTLGALSLGGYLMAGASPSRVPGLV